MSKYEETMTKTDSPTSVAKVPSFGASPLERKPSRLNLLMRKVGKSKDKRKEKIDEAEIRRLEKQVELLKKKRNLVLTIKRMERGGSDDDSGSPKRWSSLGERLWMKHDDNDDDSYGDDDDDEPVLNGIHSALDWLEAGFDSVINEIKDLNVMFAEDAAKDGDQSKTAGADETNVAALAAPIMMLAKTLSNTFTGADEAPAAESKDGEELQVADQPNENAQLDDNDNASATKGASKDDNAASEAVCPSPVEDGVQENDEDGIEAPPFETFGGGLSSAVDAESSTAPKKRGWFAKARKTTKNDANENKNAAKTEPIDTVATDKSVKTNDTTEASDASNVEDFVHAETIVDMDEVDKEGTAKAAKKKNWTLKPFGSKKNMPDGTCAIEENSANLVVGAGAAVGTAATVGLANQNIDGSEAPVETLKTEDEMNPAVVEEEEEETPRLCDGNETMEGDMPTDVAERADCIKEDDASVENEEHAGSFLIENTSAVNDQDQDEHYDLSDCNCEDCMNKSSESNEEEEECEGIELELVK